MNIKHLVFLFIKCAYLSNFNAYFVVFTNDFLWLIPVHFVVKYFFCLLPLGLLYLPVHFDVYFVVYTFVYCCDLYLSVLLMYILLLEPVEQLNSLIVLISFNDCTVPKNFSKVQRKLVLLSNRPAMMGVTMDFRNLI